MDWRWIRIGIFSIAFLIGLLGTSRTSTGLGAGSVERKSATVELQCTPGTTVVVPDKSQQIPGYVVSEVRKRAFD
jgi:hypothetical protein